MEATTAEKSTHRSSHLNSSSCNQQVKYWSSKIWLDVSFSSTAEWSVPLHHFFVSYFLAASEYCFDMEENREEILEQFSVCSCGKQCLSFDNNYQCSHIIFYSCNLRVWKEWQRLRSPIQRTYRVSQLSKFYPTYYGGLLVIAQCQSLEALQCSTLSMVESCSHTGPHVGMINCFDTTDPEIHQHRCTQAQQ